MVNGGSGPVSDYATNQELSINSPGNQTRLTLGSSILLRFDEFGGYKTKSQL
jgi:hypothetical protein